MKKKTYITKGINVKHKKFENFRNSRGSWWNWLEIQEGLLGNYRYPQHGGKGIIYFWKSPTGNPGIPNPDPHGDVDFFQGKSSSNLLIWLINKLYSHLLIFRNFLFETQNMFLNGCFVHSFTLLMRDENRFMIQISFGLNLITCWYWFDEIALVHRIQFQLNLKFQTRNFNQTKKVRVKKIIFFPYYVM